jgi:hypothetical protein
MGFDGSATVESGGKMKGRDGFLRLFVIGLVLLLSESCGTDSDSDDGDNNIEAKTIAFSPFSHPHPSSNDILPESAFACTPDRSRG